MSLERDRALARLLEAGLEPPVARPGAEQRVERKLAARFANTTRMPLRWTLASAVVLACAAALTFGRWLVHTPATSAAGGEPSLAWLPLEHARAAIVGTSKLRVDHEDARETVVELVAGRALFHVQKGTGRHFIVEVGRSRVEVVGTVFGVERDGELARVEVVEGIVRVSGGGAQQTLTAGESSPSGTHLFSLAPAALAALQAPFPALTAPLAPPSAPTDAVPSEQSPSASPPSQAPAKSAHALGIRSAAPAAAPTPSSTPVAPVTPPSDDAYRNARALERAGAIAEATSAYGAIAHAPGPNADDAAFALVRLPAEQHEASGVQAAATAYRAAFPAGRYARDVDVLALNAHLALHDQGSALSDADTFIAHFPNDARAWRFRLVRAADRARHGDCNAAANELAAVPDGAEKTAILDGCSAH